MKLTLHTFRQLSRLLLGLMLFAQGVVDAHACVPLATIPVTAIAAMMARDSMPCQKEAAPDRAASSPSACLAHCSQAGQVNVDLHAANIAAPVSVIAWSSIQPQAQPSASSMHLQLVALNTGPPIPIRFCSLLN